MRKKDINWIKREFDTVKSLIKHNEYLLKEISLKQYSKIQELIQDNDLVILVKDNKTRIYDNGRELKNIKRILFEHDLDSLPTVECEKMVIKENE